MRDGKRGSRELQEKKTTPQKENTEIDQEPETDQKLYRSGT